MAWTDPATGSRKRPVPADPRPALGWAAGLLLGVAALALFSAGAETWRFVLMVRGRTEVLAAREVATSDVLVAVGGLFTPVVTVAAVVVAVTAVLRTSRWAADRAAVAPPRSTSGLLLRLVVPGWNVYGAGPVLLETHALLLRAPAVPDPLDPVARDGRVRRRDRRLILLWWSVWCVGAVLVVATLLRGLGGSLQAIADTVELHIAVDLAAAATAALGAVVLLRFRRLADVTPTVGSRWVVRPPEPTRRRTGLPGPGMPRTATHPGAPSVGSPPGPVRGRDLVPTGPTDDRVPADPSATVSA